VPSGETQFGAGPASFAAPGAKPSSWRTASGQRAAAAIRAERTSPLVGRRDPPSVGLRPGDQSRPPRRAGPRCPGRALGGGAQGVGPRDVPRHASSARANGSPSPLAGLPAAVRRALPARDPL
jgi:hypothetical protein